MDNGTVEMMMSAANYDVANLPPQQQQQPGSR
jgi:hypothetical protein